jgi:DNA-binding transcriptional LysR family regulator
MINDLTQLTCFVAVAERRMVWRADNQNPALDAFRRFASECLVAN